MGLTAELCERVAAARFEDLPAEAVAAARRLVLDGLAVALGRCGGGGRDPDHGRALPQAWRRSAVHRHWLRIPHRPGSCCGAEWMRRCTCWTSSRCGVRRRTRCPPRCRSRLRLAEARGASGREVLTALVKGIEIQGWLREASGQFTPDVLQFHPPGLVGPMGAVAAAGHLLGLDAKRLANAFGIAASRAGSVFGNVGTMTKSTHCGQAGSLGLEAALMAEAGFTGDAATFESPQGYAATFHRGTFMPDELRKFGQAPWRVVRPGYAIKMFPSQFGTHFVITAGLDTAAADSRCGGDPVGDADRAADGLCRSAATGHRTVGQIQPAIHAGQRVAGRQGRHRHVHRSPPARTRTCRRCCRRSCCAWTSRSRRGSRRCMWWWRSSWLMGAYWRRVATDRAACGASRRSPTLDHLVKVRDCLATRLHSDAVERCIALASRIDTLAPPQVSELMALVGTGA